jgi:AcrR family transcriptional regulator
VATKPAGDKAVVAPRPGRRPSERTQKQILDASRELLAEGGVQGLTVEGVAARSGVAKTTIYRRYRSKDELALAVLIDMVDHVAAVPDLGDARAELVVFVDRATKVLGSTLMGQVMKGLVSDLATDPDLAKAFRERVVGRRVAEIGRVVERGIARGELRSDTDPDFVNELLFGPVYYRLLLSGKKLDGAFAERIVAAVLPTFAVDSRRANGTTKSRRRG